MRTTRKIFLALVLTLVVAAVMSICAFAFDINTDLPQGVPNTTRGQEGTKWVDSGYKDVDTEEGWYMIGVPNKNYTATAGSYPTCAYLNGGYFYWHKEDKKGVWIPTSTTMAGEWGEEIVTTIEAAKGVASNAKNSLEERVHFRMAWVFNQLAENGYVFETIEFRLPKKTTSCVFFTVGLVTKFIEAKTVLFDVGINHLSLQNTDRGLFIGNAALTTLAHVDFDIKNDNDQYTGEYSTEVAGDVVDLSGFKKITPYRVDSNTTAGKEGNDANGNGNLKDDYDRLYSTSQILQSASSIKKVVYFNKALANTTVKTWDESASITQGDELAGYIDVRAFSGCKALTEITLTSPLTFIGANAFDTCTSLTTIDLKGGVAEGATIASSAFTSATQEIEVYVYSDEDVARAESLFASVTNITVVNNSATKRAIRADGYSIRIDDSSAFYKGPALRAEFTLLKEKVDDVKAKEGYVLADYGIVVFSANTFNNMYGGSEEAILAAIEDGLDETEQKKIKMVSAASGPYVSVNANGDKTFAAAITGIDETYYDSAVYTYAYAAWSNGTETKYTYTTYTSTRVTGKQAHSLYDATVFAFANGIVNSQNFKMSTEVELWDILQKGAFSVTETETKAPSTLLTLTQGYKYDAEGKFTYVDLPLRAWNMYKNEKGNIVWNSRGVTVEETATTGILWSILENGNEYVVVYRADPTFDGKATLPKLNDDYGASAPYSSKYFDASKVVTDPTANGLLKTATIYSPILTDANSNNIKAIVIDYGVDVLGEQSLCTASVTTIVYPEGMTAGRYLLAGCTNLKDLVYVTADKSYLADYNVKSLVDLTGFSRVSDLGVAMNAAAVENILLPEAAKIKNEAQYGFGGAKALSRVWTVGFDMPEAGVMDLSQTGIKGICKGYFNNLDNIDDVYMPETFTYIDAYSMATLNQTTDTGRWNVFGNNSSETKLNIHVENWKALNCIANTFYEARQNPAYNNGKENSGIEHYVDYLKLTYEGVTKTVLEWRADFPADPDAAQ